MDWWIYLPWIIRTAFCRAQRGESCIHRDGLRVKRLNLNEHDLPSSFTSCLSLIHFLLTLQIMHTASCPEAHLSHWQSTCIWSRLLNVKCFLWIGQASTSNVRGISLHLVHTWPQFLENHIFLRTHILHSTSSLDPKPCQIHTSKSKQNYFKNSVNSKVKNMLSYSKLV